MVVPIAPIGAISPLNLAAAAPVTSSPATSGTDFSTVLSKGLDAVTSAQQNANSLSVQAATGQLVDPAQLTIATTQASLMTQLATTVTSKGIAAFTQVMGMQA